MKKTLILLLLISLLYLVPSLIIKAIYGPSYGFMEGEDCWMPDSQGGWIQHGQPADEPPYQLSQNVPLVVAYLPIFLPALLLLLFIFTPLSKIIISPVEHDPDEVEEDEEHNTL